MNAIRTPIEAASRRAGGTPLGVAGWLALAAAPAFVIMALLTGLADSAAPMGMAMRPASPLGGMAPMYVLMAVFHAPAWLRLIDRRADGNFGRRG